MYLPTNVDEPPTAELDWDICRDSDFVFRGAKAFKIGCCQKEIETDNGTMIRSGLFPLTSSSECPRKDEWIDYAKKHDFYHCKKSAVSMAFAYIAIAVVVVLGSLSGLLVILTKLLFGRKRVFKKVHRTVGKIKAMSKTMAGQKLLAVTSRNYKRTNSFRMGVETSSVHHKNVVMQDAIVNRLENSLFKKKIKRKSLFSAEVVPVEDDGKVATVSLGPSTAIFRKRSKGQCVREEAERLRREKAAIQIQRQVRGRLARRRCVSMACMMPRQGIGNHSWFGGETILQE